MGSNSTTATRRTLRPWAAGAIVAALLAAAIVAALRSAGATITLSRLTTYR